MHQSLDTFGRVRPPKHRDRQRPFFRVSSKSLSASQTLCITRYRSGQRLKVGTQFNIGRAFGSQTVCATLTFSSESRLASISERRGLSQIIVHRPTLRNANVSWRATLSMDYNLGNPPGHTSARTFCGAFNCFYGVCQGTCWYLFVQCTVPLDGTAQNFECKAPSNPRRLCAGCTTASNASASKQTPGLPNDNERKRKEDKKGGVK